MDGHLINTGGIISGDYYAQLYLVSEEALQRPLVGMPIILKSMELPCHRCLGIFRPGLKRMSPDSWHTENSLRPKNLRASCQIGWRRRLPKTCNLWTIRYAGNCRILGYPLQEIISKITYHVYWNDNTVNAYAWQDRNGRHVAILGGLIRHMAVEIEGLGLVIAHEIAHHYGGPPKYPGNPWATCEGQSDYWGAMVAMREAWWADEALQQIEKGADQLYRLLRTD